MVCPLFPLQKEAPIIIVPKNNIQEQTHDTTKKHSGKKCNKN